MRLRLTAVLIGMVVCFSSIFVLDHFPLFSARIERHVSQNLVLGILIAAITCGVATAELCKRRKQWPGWILLVVFLILHFAFVVPLLGRFGVIRHGLEELYLWIAFAEVVGILTALHYATE